MAVKSIVFNFQKITQALLYSLIIFFIFFNPPVFAHEKPLADPFPEQSEINQFLAKEEPEGIVFLVMEHDEEALYWVLPRVTRYAQQLREKWSDLPIIILSHGDEMLSLVDEFKSLNEELHLSIKALARDYDVTFQVCGSYASFSDVDESEFPAHIDVVPSAPAEITNYRQMEYQFISLELIW